MGEIQTGCNNNCPYYYENNECIKPEGLFCPTQSITYEVVYDKQADLYHGVISKVNEISAYARKCIICGEPIIYNDKCDDVVCESCKDAIAWVKRHTSFLDCYCYIGKKEDDNK